MSASKEDIADFKFILEEAVRLKKLLNESTAKYFKISSANQLNTINTTIEAPKNLSQNTSTPSFKIHLSPASRHKLTNIAKRHIKAENMELSVDPAEMFMAICDALYIYIHKNKTIDDKSYTKILNNSTKIISNNMEDREFYFPLSAKIEGGKSIELGSVKILHKADFSNEIKKLTISERTRILNEHFDLIQNPYDTFLHITIPKCLKELAYKRAVNIANLVISIIHLFAAFFKIKSDFIFLAMNPTPNIRGLYFTKSFSSCIDFNASIIFPVGLDILWNKIEKGKTSYLWKVIDKVIYLAINQTKNEQLSDRLIDAIIWFGDAVRDTNKKSQIIKLVTALERLVILKIEKDDNNLTQRFYQRTSCLIARGTTGDQKEWMRKSKKLYELRCDLVHGSFSFNKSHEHLLNFCPFILTSNAIFSACVIFNEIGLEKTKYETDLQTMYNNITRTNEVN
jgi:Apea-like HEPN